MRRGEVGPLDGSLLLYDAAMLAGTVVPSPAADRHGEDEAADRHSSVWAAEVGRGV